MNALVDPDINAHEASAAGVLIELVVRGICCLPRLWAFREYPCQIHRRPLPRTRPHLLLRPGHAPPHLKAAVYISSADMMLRNLDSCVEALCPILNPDRARAGTDQTGREFEDNEQSWQLLADGSSRRIEPAAGEEGFNAYTYFMTN